MYKLLRKFGNVLFHRLGIVAVLIIAQLVLYFVLLALLREISPLVGVILVALSAFLVLWIRLPDGGEKFTWLKKLMDLFPGDSAAIVYLEDRKKKLQTRCVFHEALLDELRETLGEKNVVLKGK